MTMEVKVTESQSAVQSLLDSQQQPEHLTDDEVDVFHCGRCKKQFTTLPNFLLHKQMQCLLTFPTELQSPLSDTSALYSHQLAVQHLEQQQQQQEQQQPVDHAGSSFTTQPTLSLSQLQQNVMLNDDFITFTNLEPSALQGPAIQMVAAPINIQSSNVAILGTIQAPAELPTADIGLFLSHSQHQLKDHSLVQYQDISFQPNVPVGVVPHLPTYSTSSQMVASFESSPSEQPLHHHEFGQRQQPNDWSSSISVAEKSMHESIPLSPNRGVLHTHGKATQLKVPHAVKEATGGRSSKRHPLRCQYCSKLFQKNFDLQQHLRAHTGEKPFQCIVCGRAFAQKSNVKKHMTTHKVWPGGTASTLPKELLSDMVCSDGDHVVVDVPHSLQTLSRNGNEGLLTANVNGGGVNLTGCHGSESLQIECDGSGTSTNKQVRVVVLDNSYVCGYCQEKFTTFFQLKTHMVLHKSEQVYRCVMKECGESFKELESFLEHIKLHEKEMSYRCHRCSQYFPSLYELGCHQYSHSLFPGQDAKPGPRHFQCVKCGNKYTTPESLEHHMATTSHEHTCQHCNKVFACERFLRRHLVVHGASGQFQCPTCGKHFKTEHYVKSHMLIHTGENPFQCEVCQASFNRKDKLKRHMTIHDAVKKYRCPFKSLTGCVKEFNRPDKLKSHIITHCGIKPFACSVCGKGFSRRPHMLSHEHGHKLNYQFKCEKCGRGFLRAKLFTDHKCQPGSTSGAQVFRRRRQRKIGRPRKRTPAQEDGDPTVKEYRANLMRSCHSTPGLRSASGIHFQNPRVVEAIVSQMRPSTRSKGSKVHPNKVACDSITEVIGTTVHLELLASPMDSTELLLEDYAVRSTHCDRGSGPSQPPSSDTTPSVTTATAAINASLKTDVPQAVDCQQPDQFLMDSRRGEMSRSVAAVNIKTVGAFQLASAAVSDHT